MGRAARSPSSSQADRVVLLHGIAPQPWSSLLPLARTVEAAGYATLCINYPSRSASIPALADFLHQRAGSFIHDHPGRTYFVTHSMGGLLARAYLRRYRPDRIGGIVMMAPPNRGSELADLLGSYRLFKWFFAPAGQQLKTTQVENELFDPVDYNLGVIAGDRAVNFLGAIILPKPNDGTVTVARTRLAGMADHITVQASHAFIMHHKATKRQVVHFLKHGWFAKQDLCAVL